ncbi:TspO/MBR family protein [Microbispora sp. NPDC088329]|uniref:TspO/MBR family protein n=1 Tax=Microbispora sp. NPDC088329 TaxID=3154869 RepID=UPI00343E5DE7
MNWYAATVTAAITLLAAIVGNLLIPTSALTWFRSLPWPRWLVPFRVFIAVGLIYYALIASVLYRALDRQDLPAIIWAVVVIVANEAWNAAFFGLRSTLAGFTGMLAFTAPLSALIVAARHDFISLTLLLVYALWVVYDIAWTAALWRTSRSASRDIEQ